MGEPANGEEESKSKNSKTDDEWEERIGAPETGRGAGDTRDFGHVGLKARR